MIKPTIFYTISALVDGLYKPVYYHETPIEFDEHSMARYYIHSLAKDKNGVWVNKDAFIPWDKIDGLLITEKKCLRGNIK